MQANDENKDDYEDYDDDDDDDDDWDWKNSPGGNFTKRYAAMRTGNNQQVFSRNLTEERICFYFVRICYHL